jgi:hypothetical protein
VQRNRWLWAVAAVVLAVCGVTASVWLARYDAPATASPDDCALVEELGQEWLALVPSINSALETGPGERSDLLAIADRESAVSDKLRAAANSVATPALKDNLNKWAEGAALLSRIQRDSANRASGLEPQSADGATFVKGSVMIHEATAALLKVCPNMPPPQGGS